MRKRFLSFIAMALGVIAVNAQGTINLAGLTFTPGETKQFSIELNDETAYCGFQMDLVLPDGFSVAEVMNNDVLVKDITLDDARKESSHIIDWNEVNGAIRIISYSNQNAAYKGTTGSLVNISITASEDVTKGDYAVELKNIEFTTPDAAAKQFENVSSTFKFVLGYTASVNCAAEGEAMLSSDFLKKGTPLKLMIAPKDGYKVSSLMLNGGAVDVENNVYNIASVLGDVVFDVAFEAVVPDTVVVETIVVDTIEIETIEVDTVYLAEVNEVPVPEITFVDGMLNISCALQGAKIYYTLDGTVPTTASEEYTEAVAVSEDCVAMAIAVVASDAASMEIVGTGIGSVVDEIVSCRYFTEGGIEIDEPCEGVNIMIVKYASGKTETKKVIVRKK